MNQRRACDLVGKQGLILGIANKDSIAFGCAKAFRSLGADLAITYIRVARLAEPLMKNGDLCLP